jgi:two-component system chemotaxis sensor kinase CheA
VSLHDEALREFLVESGEGLDQLERDFIALEADPSARDRLALVFRAVHTIKGTSGFFGFSRLETLTHVGENLLSRLRDGTLALTPEITSALLAMADRVRRILRAIELDGSEGHENHDELVTLLGSLATGTSSAPPASGPLSTQSPAGSPSPVEWGLPSRWTRRARPMRGLATGPRPRRPPTAASAWISDCSIG